MVVTVEAGRISPSIRKDNQTPWILVEVKALNHKNSIQQLKSYLNNEGSPIGVGVNGKRITRLFRPYSKGNISGKRSTRVMVVSIIDVIEVLVGGDRPRKYWNDLKKNFIPKVIN